jgi:hypothetical protein
MFTPDPDLCPTRSKNSNKKDEKNICSYLFSNHKYHKFENYFIFELAKKKNFEPIYKEF